MLGYGYGGKGCFGVLVGLVWFVDWCKMVYCVGKVVISIIIGIYERYYWNLLGL